MTTVDHDLTTFSPLESLFLCQSVAQYGVANSAFESISEELRKSSDSAANNEVRLGAESLKTFFLRLLKEEAKTHLQNARDKTSDGEIPDGASVKTSTSPRLSKIEDANAHVQLLPQLVDKLYVSYKDEALREIRAEEQRYSELIAQRNELQTQRLASKKGVALPPGETTPANASVSSPIQRRDHDQDLSAPRRPSTGPKDGRSSSRPRTSDLKIDDLLNPETPVAQSPQQTPSAIPRRYGTQSAPTSEGPRPQPGSSSAFSPHQATLPSHTALRHGVQEPVRPNIGGSPNFFNGQSPYNAPPVLPPIPGMTSGSPLSTTHWSPSNSPTLSRPSQSMQSRQLPSPVDPMRRTSLPPPITSPSVPKHQIPTSVYQQSAQYAARPPPFQQQSFYQHPPGRGGVMLPPFQVQSPSPNVQPPFRPNATPLAARTPYPAQQYAASEPRPLAHRNVSDLRPPFGPVSQTPPARAARNQVSQGDHLYTPGSTTGWRLSSNTRFPPDILRAPSLSPERDVEPMAAEPARATPAKVAGPKKGAARKIEDAASAAGTKTSAIRKGKGAKAISTTPSAAASSANGGRTRSQSVVSQYEDKSVLDNVKIERNAQVNDIGDRSMVGSPEELSEDQAQPAKVSASKAVTRKRKREQGSFSTEHDLQSRADTADADVIPSSTAETDAAPLEMDALPSHKTTILAYRNFHKMTAPIMNNITSHKHASIFANPVKDRTAEGYSDIIRRPQDLKSIRTAIMAGSRAVAAATASSSADSPAGAGSATGTSTPTSSASAGGLVELPWSVDLVPPRGIVNGAQLEQEVMRMFANAVMFNPGNEGVVEDAREMFENVEAAVQAWRATQKEITASNISASMEKGKHKKGEDDESKKGREESVDETGSSEVADANSVGGPATGRRRRTLA